MAVPHSAGDLREQPRAQLRDIDTRGGREPSPGIFVSSGRLQRACVFPNGHYLPTPLPWPLHNVLLNAGPYLGPLLILQPSQYSLGRILEPINIEGIILVGPLAQDDLPVPAQASISPASRYHLAYSPIGCNCSENAPFI